METVSIQIPAKLFAAIYARHEEDTGNVINECLSNLLDDIEHDSTSPVGGTRFMRPGRGTVTRRVWDIADIYFSETGKADRSEVVKICMQEDINVNTASTQFSHWQNAMKESEE